MPAETGDAIVTASNDYQRISRAIEFLRRHADEQPALGRVAAAAGLSPTHFQRVFSRWVGVSPKRFLQVLTVERARALLDEPRPLLEVAGDAGLSGVSRLHDHFVTLEAATPGEVRAAGNGITISFGIAESPFGHVFIAETPRGICQLSFVAGPTESDDAGSRTDFERLGKRWHRARLIRDDGRATATADRVFTAPDPGAGPLSLHVAGTNFQVAVWRALLDVQAGGITTYADLASRVGRPTAARAVGLAVGANPIAFAIPCHRVIRRTGELGGYRWGPPRKQAILAWEAARLAD